MAGYGKAIEALVTMIETMDGSSQDMVNVSQALVNLEKAERIHRETVCECCNEPLGDVKYEVVEEAGQPTTWKDVQPGECARFESGNVLLKMQCTGNFDGVVVLAKDRVVVGECMIVRTDVRCDVVPQPTW